jgi:toxin ParE1/3/4
MNVTFDPAARDDLDRIFAWIEKESPRAAYELISRIEAKVSRLATPQLAYMGRPGLVEGTRELIEYPYIVVYKVYEELNEIVVISIVHGARER